MAAGQGKKKIQNRYYPRLAVEVLLAYQPLSSPGAEKKVVKSSSLGLGGLMFEADRPFEEGSAYRLDLVLGESKLEVKAEVVYSNPVGSDLFQVGFNFLEMTDEQRERLTAYFLQEYEKVPRDIT